MGTDVRGEERTEEEPFGFQFEYREPHYDDEEPGWAVFLPHQCDEWTIVGGYWTGVPLAAAVTELERFIAEAQTTLEKLRVATPPPGGEGK